jgi:site-specific recombinase XerD
MSEELSSTLTELRKTAKEAINNLPPRKTRSIYDKDFKKFQLWCDANNVQIITENIMLAYLQTLSKDKKASTLWSTYSKLKACLNVYKNVDISKFSRVHAYLKIFSQGYEPKKSKILEFDHIHRFIVEADDNVFLAIKVHESIAAIQYYYLLYYIHFYK